jgi:RNA polymerase sigma factor (TIGR02999 family)
VTQPTPDLPAPAFADVYAELRRLAAAHLAAEAPWHTLNATALVHEAYLRLVGPGHDVFANRRHFFAAAAEAMRRILVEAARHKARLKRGGGRERVPLDDGLRVAESPDELLALDEALAELERHDPSAAELVKLRYFAGLSHQEAADALGIGRRAADRLWALARAWLLHRLGDG